MTTPLGKVFATAMGLTFCSLANGQTITLEQAMADPDWIGRAPQNPYWSDDGGSVYFTQKRAESQLKQLYQLDLDRGDLQPILPESYPSTDVASRTLSSNDRLKTYTREGDVYVKDLRSGHITQLTRTAAIESSAQFTADNSSVIFSREDTLFVRDLDSGLEYQAAELLSEKSPQQSLNDANPSYLESQQSRLFEIIKLQKEREIALRESRENSQRADADRALLPFYLGEKEEVLSSSLSPNERWMAVVIQSESERQAGRPGTMSNYVTATGYTENRELRARVGATHFANQRLILLDLQTHQQSEIDLTNLPGRNDQALLEQLGIQPDEDNDEEASINSNEADQDSDQRKIRLQGLSWSKNGERLLFHGISRDNKDHWLLGLNTNDLTLTDVEGSESSEPLSISNSPLTLIHHNHDPAWINSRYLNAHWLPNSKELVFQSEQDGYLHLYRWAEGHVTQLTKGEFEVYDPTISKDGKAIYFRGNVEHPTIYEIYRVAIANQELTQLTDLGGMNNFVLSPDENNLLITHSEALMPPELYLQRTKPKAIAKKLTSTVSEQFKAIDWTQPEFVEVRSSYSPASIHSRVYTPNEDSINRPAVIFIHGAGYLQNAHQGWSGYFREFMFHSFLVKQGYVVLDMDYRASQGYGREWRTGIYQRMGTPEIQDLANGIDWLVGRKNVDRARVCTYGGSYGGFLTLMALFKKPDLFACGAALRPVTDWASYNHNYTSNILNIPEIDPGSFERSSPIEFAEGLEAPLLIAHGMQDNNVFFQDSVRLVQRLIELKKENFEMAIYPIESHGFREPSSWLDEYRRIYKLLEESINQTIN
jgi:dipeptidyl aminopeptidase/acylaminoacyl peptidase